MAYRFPTALAVAGLALAVVAGCGKQPSIYSVMLNFQQNAYPNVVEECEKLLEQNPNDVQAYRFLIKASRELNRLDELETKYEAWVKQEPDNPVAHFAYGYALVQANEYDKGLEQLERALELDPKLEYANYVVGWIHFNPLAGHFDESKGLEAWQREIEINASSLGALQVYRDLGSHYRETGDFEKARQELRKFRDNAFSEGDRVAARDLLEQLKDQELKMLQLKQAAEAPDASAEVLTEYGKWLYEWRKPEEAVQYWERAADQQPDSAVLQNSLGMAYMESNQDQQAIAAFQHSAELDGEYAEPHYNLGILLDTEGHYAQALAQFERYLELQPFSQQAEVIRQRVEELKQQGYGQDAAAAPAAPAESEAAPAESEAAPPAAEAEPAAPAAG